MNISYETVDFSYEKTKVSYETAGFSYEILPANNANERE